MFRAVFIIKFVSGLMIELRSSSVGLMRISISTLAITMRI